MTGELNEKADLHIQRYKRVRSDGPTSQPERNL
jgi:hypothetical protein